jgi:hypothetical protein
MARSKWQKHLPVARRMARRRAGVVGVDYGVVYKGNAPLKTRGIRFHVARKRPLDELPPEHVIPSRMADLRCDVVEACYSLQGNPRAVCDPIQPGVSVGNLQHATTGTMGLAVRDRQSQMNGMLSNWHVLCGSRDAKAGEQISQPGPLHLGTQPARVAAVLERWLQLDLGCDAALALLAPGIVTNQSLFDSRIAVTGIESPRVGMRLEKFGAVSLLTHGIIDGVEGSYQVDYAEYGDQSRWMDGFRIVADSSQPESDVSLAGDSGAVWIDRDTRKAVALHFAGEDGLGPTANYALAQPILRILTLLDVDLA